LKLFLFALGSFTCFFLQPVQADPILKGSIASQIKQNHEADKSGLIRIADSEELELFKENGLLIKIPDALGVKIDPRLDARFCYIRPSTARFLINLGKEFQMRFNASLQINSAIRTVERQKIIAENNLNAAPTEGDRMSSHLTGASIDIAKKPLNRVQKKWLRAKLMKLELDDLIEATEEHRQAVFHIMVFERYKSNEVLIASTK